MRGILTMRLTLVVIEVTVRFRSNRVYRPSIDNRSKAKHKLPHAGERERG